MGQAKRRGTREQRIAQAIERKQLEDAAFREEYQRREAERRAELAAMPPEERKQVILSERSPHSSRMLLAAMAGLLAMPRVK
jgi:hypothetical protein